jgi:hypothetical protein
MNGGNFMRVVNWRKWQRTKGLVAGVIVLIGLGYMGGLEDKPGELPTPPNVLGVIVCFSLAGMIVWNIYQHDKRRGRGW